MNQTVWVTGAAGFSGRFMIDHLKALATPPRVVAVDLLRTRGSKADAVLEVDLGDANSVAESLGRETPDIVIHLAGLMPPNNEDEMRSANVRAAEILANALRSDQSQTVRLLSIGSAAEYGSPDGPLREDQPCAPSSAYGQTKLEQTTSVLTFNSTNLQVVVARPFNLLGPGLSKSLVAGALCQQFMEYGLGEGYIVPKGPMSSVRDFVDVRDAVSAYWTLVSSGKAGEIYNVCSGEGTSIRSLVGLMERAFQASVDIRPDYDESSVSPDVSIGDNKKLANLGWRTRYSVEDSVNAMVRKVLQV